MYPELQVLLNFQIFTTIQKKKKILTTFIKKEKLAVIY